MNILFLYVFMSGLIVFCSKNKHFLVTLLSLEFMVLVIFVFMLTFSSSSHNFFSLVFITFSACEGALGLSILVSMSRNFGSDSISLFSFS